ncbi:hypothetical protein JYU34_009985 [Plutella xylostella]|uniref:Catalase core domain-containing protein n=1 Tax=Plutella xylostella TaxID=51655 RepID=A0ABQ7QHD9_PLUXY|nr:hypothetical protein JYU34_009985 [Plutella xylostella]
MKQAAALALLLALTAAAGEGDREHVWERDRERELRRSHETDRDKGHQYFSNDRDIVADSAREEEDGEHHEADADANVDPASAQLDEWKAKHKPRLLTTAAGAPVDVRSAFTLNTDLLDNPFFLDTINSITNERIPNREVNAKGSGAFGYFEVTNDVTKYTKAKLFEKVGKRTRVLARLGTSQSETGGSDLEPLGLRGLSVKFYTEEGNLDLLSIQIPVFFFKDPQLFTFTARALRRNPKTYLKDFTAVYDFLTLHPESLHSFMWMASEYGLPRGFRRMNAFPIHCYEIYNEKGEQFYVRFKFLSELGYDSFTLKEARELGADDPDFFIRDLYNAIALGRAPAWRLHMDVLHDVHAMDFDPFDVTRLWGNGTYHTVEVGRLVLDRNVDNHFAQVEQAAFNPNHLVPGIAGPRDQLFRGRILAYTGAQIHRLGVNNHKIPVNCPLRAATYNRDGAGPVGDNERDAPVYFPNSFHGPAPRVEAAAPERLLVRHSARVDLQPARDFYRLVLRRPAQRRRLVDNMAAHMQRVPRATRRPFLRLLRAVDQELAARLQAALERLDRQRLPTLVDDVPRNTRDYSEL